jgi:hypothetical protein
MKTCKRCGSYNTSIIRPLYPYFRQSRIIYCNKCGYRARDSIRYGRLDYKLRRARCISQDLAKKQEEFVVERIKFSKEREIDRNKPTKSYNLWRGC